MPEGSTTTNRNATVVGSGASVSGSHSRIITSAVLHPVPSTCRLHAASEFIGNSGWITPSPELKSAVVEPGEACEYSVQGAGKYVGYPNCCGAGAAPTSASNNAAANAGSARDMDRVVFFTMGMTPSPELLRLV